MDCKGWQLHESESFEWQRRIRQGKEKIMNILVDETTLSYIIIGFSVSIGTNIFLIIRRSKLLEKIFLK